MARSASLQPTEVELQILRIIWELSSPTARQIHNRITADRDTNYSTTVKMLENLHQKSPRYPMLIGNLANSKRITIAILPSQLHHRDASVFSLRGEFHQKL